MHEQALVCACQRLAQKCTPDHMIKPRLASFNGVIAMATNRLNPRVLVSLDCNGPDGHYRQALQEGQCSHLVKARRLPPWYHSTHCYCCTAGCITSICTTSATEQLLLQLLYCCCTATDCIWICASQTLWHTHHLQLHWSAYTTGTLTLRLCTTAGWRKAGGVSRSALPWVSMQQSHGHMGRCWLACSCVDLQPIHGSSAPLHSVAAGGRQGILGPCAQRLSRQLAGGRRGNACARGLLRSICIPCQ